MMTKLLDDKASASIHTLLDSKASARMLLPLTLSRIAERREWHRGASESVCVRVCFESAEMEMESRHFAPSCDSRFGPVSRVRLQLLAVCHARSLLPLATKLLHISHTKQSRALHCIARLALHSAENVVPGCAWQTTCRRASCQGETQFAAEKSLSPPLQKQNTRINIRSP